MGIHLIEYIKTLTRFLHLNAETNFLIFNYIYSKKNPTKGLKIYSIDLY